MDFQEVDSTSPNAAQSSSHMAIDCAMSSHMGSWSMGEAIAWLIDGFFSHGTSSAASCQISNGTAFQVPRHVQIVHRGGGFETALRKIPLIGCGGISSGEDAYKKIWSGATLVQLYTDFAYDGHALIPQIKVELAECLEKDGFKSISEAVGADCR